MNNLEQKINHLEHLLKVVLKNQEQIKAHLWLQPENKPEASTKEKNREIIKQEAINYINSVVMPEIETAQAEQGDFAAQGITDWAIAQVAKPVSEYLKARLLEYISDALTELRKKAIPYAVQIADWVLDKLEDIIVNKYSGASQQDKEAFKEAIKTSFPNSRLLTKLN